jgi:outer membrane receptor protein involved in Fe transport
VLGAHNSIRIPAFVQLDLRVAKRFKLGGSELEAYLDVQNVTNRENPEELAYGPDYRERRYVLGLPVLPVIGAKWSF